MLIKKPLLLISFLLFFISLTVPVMAKGIPAIAIRDTIPDTIPGPVGLEDRVYDKVEIEASYPGGDNAWRKFLEQNLNAETPLKHKAPPGFYTVVIQFTVDKEGKVSDIKPLTSHGYGMEEEVIRLLRIAPRWKPAWQDGRNVRAYRKQPVTFQVEGKSKKKNKSD